MQHVKSQHLVPEFLLKNFSQDKLKIWSFDKTAINERWNNIKNRSILSTPTQEFIYDRNEGDPNNSLEYYLRDIENKAAPIIEKLIREKDLTSISNFQKEIIALFTVSQIFRTIDSYNDIQRIQNELIDFVKPHYAEIDTFPTKEVWLDTIEECDELVKYLLDKSWSLLISNDEFIISDNPVVRSNTKYKIEHRGNLGLNSKGIEIYFPISSSVILCMFCRETYAQVENLVISDLNPDNIEYQNWLQIVWSDRFIYSNNSKFELINEMISKGESLSK